MFKGVFTALITPFRDGEPDKDALRRLVDWQISEGVHGLVPCGTTGESPTLSQEEHRRINELCVDATRRRVPVIVGCGSNSTAEAVELVRHAEEIRAEAALVVTPYYNKPTQEGLFRHFKEVAAACKLPLFIYDIPGRSAVKIADETIARLVKTCKNIIGIKDAANDLSRPQALRQLIGEQFHQFSGEDATALAHLAEGGVGCISVSANVAPKLCASLQEAWWANGVEQAQDLNRRLAVLNRVLFIEGNPAPVKYAASLLKLAKNELRLPLCPISRESEKAVAAVVKELKLKPPAA